MGTTIVCKCNDDPSIEKDLNLKEFSKLDLDKEEKLSISCHFLILVEYLTKSLLLKKELIEMKCKLVYICNKKIGQLIIYLYQPAR